ncbi:aminotransferase class III-fold pyridoxal phosphate-dependent enzyme [Pseudomaricurvus alkylphenolicus]|uniref:aminotransferase family protein n=1 Tax=Pseudomaricurvus alkylphenolicus TaxID=1306991 RepID=UPI001422507F|nr:aminotransferase [Pseudomaricurvus alkylphenolicus]NIB41387.1 aminotransferase class III-fold pyridoxal phosphate-dependent enzyme [Pseudomaricurvus alkylphenolicus]
MTTELQSLVSQDADVLLHPASSITALLQNGPDMIVSGNGCFVEDVDGRRLLDAVGGLWCVNAGYGRQELAQVMKEAAEQLGYYHTFSNASNPWQVQLAQKLLQIAPAVMGKVFFGNGGSDANDTLVKIAWHYHALRGNHGKTKVIARQQAYHGTSISTASLTGLGGFHREFPLPLDFVLRVECPHFYTRGLAGESEAQFCDRLIDEVRQLIEREGANNIAAFFAEPIHAAGGIIEPPADYYPKLKALLQQHDILLVADEVVCGYGRTGSWFGSTLLDFEPDMISTAKGLTSGYFPMSAAFMTDAIWEVLKQGSEQLGAFSHGYTYSGHPVGCAVALANLQLLENEGLVEKAKENGAYLHRQLAQRFEDHAHVGEIRGRGLLAGVQLVLDKDNRTMPDTAEKWPLKVSQAARKKGVIIRPLPSVATLAISPPLTISREEIDLLVTALGESIDEVVGGQTGQ